jgi:hypothetical protein
MNRRNLRSGLGPDRVRVEGTDANAFNRAANLFKALSTGIMGDFKKHQYAMSKSEARQAKDARAVVRRHKEERRRNDITS